MNIKNLEYKLVDFLKTRDYENAINLIENSLIEFPANLFFQRSQIFVLYKLDKINDAKRLAENKFNIFKNDTFFIKTYLSILEKQKDKNEIEQISDFILNNSFNFDEESSLYLVNLFVRNLENEKLNQMIHYFSIKYPENNEIKNAANLKNSMNYNNYKKYKENYKDMDTSKAIEEINDLLTMPKFNDDCELLLYLAELYKEAKQYDKSMETYKSSLSIKDNEFTRKMIGYLYYKTKDYENAFIYLKDIFTKNPTDYFLSASITKIFEKKLGKDRFIKYIEEVLSINPETKNLYGLLNKAKKWKT